LCNLRRIAASLNGAMRRDPAGNDFIIPHGVD
jgi:hypothetical protein